MIIWEFYHFYLEPNINAATCAQALMEEIDQGVRNKKNNYILGLQLFSL